MDLSSGWTKTISWYITQANSAGLKDPCCLKQSKQSFDKMCGLFYFEILFSSILKKIRILHANTPPHFILPLPFEVWALTLVLWWGCDKRGNRASEYLLSPTGWMFVFTNLAWPTWSICSAAFVCSRHFFDSWTSLWSFATKSLDIASSFCIFAIWPSLWMAVSLASCKEVSSSWIFC